MSNQQPPQRQFRSILPHEPLDFDQYDDKGYIHLQGAFEPKREDTRKHGAEKSSEESLFIWKSSQELQNTLTTVLGDGNFYKLKLPSPVKFVEVLEPVPPFTKIRLHYATPQQALRIHAAWKVLKLSPQDLFATQQIYDKDGTAIRKFARHPCQTNMITTKPLPSACKGWPRSNPPKFRRLLHDRDDQAERANTRFVYVVGLMDTQRQQDHAKTWNQDIIDLVQAMRKVFGSSVEIFIPKKQQSASFESIKSCHLGFASPQEAQHAVTTFQGKTVSWEHPFNPSVRSIRSGPLFLDYATITSKSKHKQACDAGMEMEKGEPSRPECTSTSNHVNVPGLVVIPDFISEDQEQVLMAVLTGPQAPWAPQQRNKSQTGAVKRKVQHYGYVFDYQTADVLRDRSSNSKENPANCPPLPAVDDDGHGKEPGEIMKDLVRQGKGWDLLAHVIEKTRHCEFQVTKTKTVMFPDVNQLTINQYKPGEGIGSHVDTPSAFGDGLISISLNSGVVMEFRKVKNIEEKDAPPLKKLVYLPARSLVLMSGPARYEWEHQIVTRRTDTHEGKVLPRKLRVSLTLRTALKLDGTPMPRVESNFYPPRWGNNTSEESRKNSLITPDTERDHVHAVYDAIATQWHHTRGKRGVLWPGATQFLKNLPVGSVVADVGCGDGKYFPAIWEAGSFVIGTDISRPLLETAFKGDAQAFVNENVADACKVSTQRQALQARPAVAVADCMSVPFQTNSCDAAICIAVMHHLSTLDRRIRCIEELVRIVKPGGRINVQAWAMEQSDDSRRRFAATDVFVPFNAQPKYLDKSKATESLNEKALSSTESSRSVAEMYSEAYVNADYDEQKGLVVFQRYCHLYRAGEMDEIVHQIAGVRLVESGYETGNHFVILEVE